MQDKRRILVIGSNAFAGADLIDLLLEDQRNQVVGISRSPEKGPLFLPYLRHAGADYSFHQLDLNRDMPAIQELCSSFQPQYVVNFAGQSEVAPSWDNPGQWFATNAVALAELVAFLKGRPWLERFVQISSPEVYGTCAHALTEDAPYNPSTPYAASKAAADMLLLAFHRHFAFPAMLVRSTNYYGAHQQLWKIIPRALIYMRLGRTIELHGGGRAVKSFIHVRDCSRGELLAMLHGRPGAIYHFSPERGHAVRDIVARLAALRGLGLEDVSRPVGERLGQDAAYVIDSSMAMRELGWAPQVGLDEGLAETAAWVDENWDEIKRQELRYRHRP